MRYGAVIVAAGMSTRMNGFKPLMEIGGLSIAERVINNLRRAGVSDIVMVTGYNADQLEGSLKGLDIEFVRNEEYASTKMFDSARMGLERLGGRCDGVFFCPVDVPLFTDQTLIDETRAMSGNGEVKVVIPSFNGRNGHPILISGEVIPVILAHNGERGLKGAYGSLPEGSIARIAVEDEGVVIDTDTREDFGKLVDIHNGRKL